MLWDTIESMLAEQIVRLPAESRELLAVRNSVFDWVERNQDGILELMSEERIKYLERIKRLEPEKQKGVFRMVDDGVRVFSEMGLCGVVMNIIEKFPLDGFKVGSGLLYEYDEEKDVWQQLFSHNYFVGPNDMLCDLVPGQLISDGVEYEGLRASRIHYPDEIFKPGGRLMRLERLLPGSVKVFGGGLGAMCTSRQRLEQALRVFVIDQENLL